MSGGILSRMVKATIVFGSNALGISDCGDAQVNDGACVSASSISKVITSEEVAAVGASRLVGSKTILLQALDGDMFIGHTSGQAVHLITKGNFYEFQGLYAIPTYIRPKGGSVEVAISEYI